MEKEERRKRIISRGNDRMALITGRIQSLEPDPLPKCSSFSILQPDPPPAQHTRSASEPLADQEHSLVGDSRRCDVVPPADDTVIKREGSSNVGEPSRLQKNNTAKRHLLGSATLQNVNFSITSTEDTRAICSIVLAFLVVLSHVNEATKPRSLITYCPLCIVLLTDILIVASRLMPYIQTAYDHDHHHHHHHRHDSRTAEDDDWGGALKLLELGLVLHQTVRAVFIDCSLYAAIVVCGISLVA